MTDPCTDALIASGDSKPLLFPLSATSADALRRTAARLADWVDQHAPGLAPRALAYTLARRREHLPVRTTVLASPEPSVTPSRFLNSRATQSRVRTWRLAGGSMSAASSGSRAQFRTSQTPASPRLAGSFLPG